MSLADLVPVALRSDFKPQRKPLTATEKHMRWLDKNRQKFNAYRRAWYARRKA